MNRDYTNLERIKLDYRFNSMITGLGYSVPEKVLTNFDFEKIVDTNDDWITERTGMKERHIGEDSVVTSDLCTDAANKALTDANLTGKDIDIIIIGTVTGDEHFPATDEPEMPEFENSPRKKEKIVTPTLSEIYAAQHQYAKAIGVYEILRKKDPDNELYSQKIEYLQKKLEESQEE